jgi:hypothetical protein
MSTATPTLARRSVPTRAKRGNAARQNQSLRQLNAWMSAQHHTLLKAARKNCMQLTGLPTFGGATADVRKST